MDSAIVVIVDSFFTNCIVVVSNFFPGLGSSAAFASLYKHPSTSTPKREHESSSKRAAKQSKEEKRAALAFSNPLNDGSLLFTCDMCGQKFARMKQLHQHKYRHHNKQKWKCYVCEKEYSSKLTLNQHLITHSPSLIRYWCDTCHKGFYDKSKYNSHVRSHAKKAEHICNICGKKFSTKFNLQRHEKCKEHLEHMGTAAGVSVNHQQQPPPQQQQQQQSHPSRVSSNHPPHNLPPPDALSLSQAILMTNGPSHIHETAGYASHFMAHLA